MRLLPLVDTGIGAGLERDMRRDNWFEEQVDNVEKTNPTIAAFLAKYCQVFDDETREKILFAVLTVYHMLEAQAESDELEEAAKLA